MRGRISYDPRFINQRPDGVTTVKTTGLVVIAHDGFAAAERCRKRNPMRARRLENLAETLISAAVVVLRSEEAMVPMEVINAISELNKMCGKPR